MTTPISRDNGTQPISLGPTGTAPVTEHDHVRLLGDLAVSVAATKRVLGHDVAHFGNTEFAQDARGFVKKNPTAPQQLENTVVQVGGLSPIESGPGAKIVGWLGNIPGLDELPGFFQKIARVGGPFAAVGGFGFSIYNTIAHWDQLKPEAKALNVLATAASGTAAVGAAGAAGFLGTAAVGIGKVVLAPAAGIAGTVMAGMKAFQEFGDPTKTAGQRGMAVSSAVIQGVGTVLCFTPLAPLGVGLLIAGGVVGVLGDWLGKIPFVNTAFQKIGDVLGGVGQVVGGAVKTVAHAVTSAVKTVADAVGGAAQAVGNFFGSLF